MVVFVVVFVGRSRRPRARRKDNVNRDISLDGLEDGCVGDERAQHLVCVGEPFGIHEVHLGQYDEIRALHLLCEQGIGFVRSLRVDQHHAGFIADPVTNRRPVQVKLGVEGERHAAGLDHDPVRIYFGSKLDQGLDEFVRKRAADAAPRQFHHARRAFAQERRIDSQGAKLVGDYRQPKSAQLRIGQQMTDHGGFSASQESTDHQDGYASGHPGDITVSVEVRMALFRGLLKEVRARLAGGPPPARGQVGQAWSNAVADAWPELADQIDGHLKRPGTAAVSTWEVCAAELARRLIGEEGEADLLTRFSDALVPTLDALSTLHKALPGALAEGRAAGERQGTLVAATRPLVLLPHGLDSELEVAWKKTVTWLDPLLATAPVPGVGLALILAVGPRLAEGAREAEAALREDLSRLPMAESAEEGLIDPFERWADVLSRAIEVEIYSAVKAMIATLRID